MSKKGGIYTIESSKGKGGGFKPWEGPQTLTKDPETGWVSLGGAYDWKEQARGVMPAVLDAVNQADDWLSAFEIGRIVGVSRSIAGSAAKELAHEGKIKLEIRRSNKHFYGRMDLQGTLGRMV